MMKRSFPLVLLACFLSATVHGASSWHRDLTRRLFGGKQENTINDDDSVRFSMLSQLALSMSVSFGRAFIRLLKAPETISTFISAPSVSMPGGDLLLPRSLLCQTFASIVRNTLYSRLSFFLSFDAAPACGKRVSIHGTHFILPRGTLLCCNLTRQHSCTDSQAVCRQPREGKILRERIWKCQQSHTCLVRHESQV